LPINLDGEPSFQLSRREGLSEPFPARIGDDPPGGVGQQHVLPKPVPFSVTVSQPVIYPLPVSPGAGVISGQRLGESVGHGRVVVSGGGIEAAPGDGLSAQKDDAANAAQGEEGEKAHHPQENTASRSARQEDTVSRSVGVEFMFLPLPFFAHFIPAQAISLNL
jgi:hypothetical protein